MYVVKSIKYLILIKKLLKSYTETNTYVKFNICINFCSKVN